jgi:8-oxo-dGTP pyrophosphatase MutT (NUDIX family)
MQIDPNRHFSALLARYETHAPDQISAKIRFAAFAASHPDVYLRSHNCGHFTASCWLVSADSKRVLLTHHKKLKRWLQLGGHADGDQDLARVALTEALEESGLTQLVLQPDIFDLDAHEIPARGTPETTGFEAAHVHWDVRFVLHAIDEKFAVSEESLALAWVNIEDLAGDINADPSLLRMARKWLVQRDATH